jgi:predicted MFS family arabinose efflux permease
VKTTRPEKFGRAYWLYMAAGACFAAGLLSFELMTFHLARSKVVATSWIPMLLALSTGFGVLASLALGKLFDRFGTLVIGAAVIISAAFAPLAFSNERVLLIVAMVPWGVTRLRTRCSRLWWPACSPKESETSRSVCSTPVTASAG